MYIFFFKQKTAYEMRISDWSSDVCSSDLNWRTIQGCLTAKRHRRRDVHWGAAGPAALGLVRPPRPRPAVARAPRRGAARSLPRVAQRGPAAAAHGGDRGALFRRFPPPPAQMVRTSCRETGVRKWMT